MRKNLFGITAILAATLPLLSGCSYFSCTYEEITLADFNHRLRPGPGYPTCMEYKGSDERLSYFRDWDFFGFFSDRICIDKNLVTQDFRSGNFPWESKPYPKPLFFQAEPGRLIWYDGSQAPEGLLLDDPKPGERGLLDLAFPKADNLQVLDYPREKKLTTPEQEQVLWHDENFSPTEDGRYRFDPKPKPTKPSPTNGAERVTIPENP